MRFMKFPLVILLSVVVSGFVGLSVADASFSNVQAQSSALERGYRTGYSDGYSAGIKDAGDKAARDYQNKEEYQRGDRSFNAAWGTAEDYRDGYQQGFEVGYAGGYDGQQFDSTIPTGLRRRGAASSVGVTTADPSTPAANPSTPAANQDNNAPPPPVTSSVAIPRNTVLSLELMTPLSTDATQRNDPFKARVLQPAELANCIVEGHVAQVKRPGKVKGVAELQLSFETIRTPDNRTTSLHAVLVEIIPLNSDSPNDIDSEGGVKGRDSTKDDAAKVGAASGIGAIIGAIAGGGKGAAIGAIIGGGAGTAGVMTQRGKDIRLEQGQQLKIRTSTDTSVL
jgi:hypothetical protein